jgi:hypothetical protein
MPTKHPLVHFPIAFFAMVMGLAASFMMAQHTQLMAGRLIGAGPLGLLVVLVLLKGTVLAAHKGAIRAPD